MLMPTKTAVETVGDLLNPRPSRSNLLISRRNANKADEAKAVYQSLVPIGKELGVALTEPIWNGDPYEFSQELVDQMDNFGRLQYEGEKIRFHWHEVTKQKGILQHTFVRDRHEHLLVRPRWRSLPYSGYMPAKAQRIHDEILKVPALKRSARVLTGVLVGEDHHEAQRWTEDTWLKQRIDAAKRTAEEAALSVNDAASSMLQRAGAMMNSFALDPCIVLGNDLVLIGWKE